MFLVSMKLDQLRCLYCPVWFYLQKRGAELVSINSDLEHSFIQNWFTANDNVPGFRNQWYTSGRTVAGTPDNDPTFIWADGNGFGSTVYWTTPESPKTPNGDYVVYQYTDDGDHEAQPGYFWIRDNGLVPHAFICEVNQNDADLISSKARDFGKFAIL